jgi:iron-sulfur cluster insertion protein
MITITENAQQKIISLLQEETEPMHLRTFVQGGGCSGFQYGFTFDQEIEQDDFVVELGQYKLLVDAMSMTYLSECTIDFVENLEGANFVIKNPAATSTCGCGNSFSI